MTEEVVLHGDDLSPQGREVRLRLRQQFPQERGGGGAGGDGEGGRGFAVFLQLHGAEEVLLQRAEHAHAVFQLAVALVVVLLGQLYARPQEQLVGAEEPPGAEAAQVLLPEFLGDGDDVAGALGVHRTQFRQALTVLGDTHRHDGAAGELPLRQVPQGAAQLVAVVPAGADYDLTVHDDTRLAEGLDIVQGTGGILVAQHGAVQLRVGGVDGLVDGADVQVDDALGLALRQVGQGDVVAQQKAQPCVVVLEVQRLAHTRRHLIHKAEHAVVGAGAHLVHQIGVEVQAQVLSLRLVQRYGAHIARRRFQFDVRHRVVAVKAVVQHVHDGVAVDGQQLFTHLDAGPLRRAVPVDGGDDGAHNASSLAKGAYAHIITKLL